MNLPKGDSPALHAAISCDLTLGELLAVIASEASEHPYVGSAKQKAAWDEIKERFAALEKAEAPASDREMSRASEPPQSHAASFRERAVDGIQWAEDWKDGQFAPAYYDKTWPVEMFALVDDYIDLARAYLEATADGG